MYLKRLEVVGFKSFAERIHLDLVPGVTSVVGPNGSGKSNIIDCIRWVLGEQSVKSLRGAKMEDVIFSGSDSRKAQNMAEVTLILDNEDRYLPLDFSEVSITRKVFRSGESEFYINRKSCRLKDIVDLFLDTGVSREAFSIISQGKVEEILSSKPEDRRTIFEEAAGVLKYKTRKKKAENKLVETNDNLIRIEDIIHELKGQIEPMKLQAGLAKEYLEKKEELERFEVALIVTEIEELHEKWQTSKERLEQYNSQEADVSRDLSIEEAKVEVLRYQSLKIDEEIEALQKSLLDMTEQAQRTMGHRDVLNERKAHAKVTCEEIQTQKSEVENKVKNTEEEKKSNEEIYNLLRVKVKDLQKNMSLLEESLNQSPVLLENQMESLKSDYIDQRNEQASLRNEKQNITDRQNLLELKKARLNVDYEEVLSKRTHHLADRNVSLTELEAIQVNFANLSAKLEKIQFQIQEVDQETKKRHENLNKGYQLIHQVKSRKDTLEEMKDDYAGYQQGVREILKAVKRGEVKGVEGAVAECIQVPSAYELAIDTALGASMQHIIVENETAGRQAITFLKSKKSGRATFLPLDVLSPRFVGDSGLKEVQKHSDFIGIAADLITFNPKYSNVIRNILGGVIVTKTLTGANEIARKLGYKFRIVTLDGDVMNPGGSMSGGAVKNTGAPLLSRNRELDSLSKKLDEMNQSVCTLKSQIDELDKQKSVYIIESEEIKQILSELLTSEGKCKEKIREIEYENRTVEEKLAMYDIEIPQINDQIQDLKEKEHKNEARLEELNQSLSDLEVKIEELSSAQKVQIENKEKRLEELTKMKVDHAQNSQRLEHVSAAIKQAQNELEQYNGQLKEMDGRIQQLSSQINDSSDDFEKMEDEIHGFEKMKDETSMQISILRGQKLKDYQELEQLEADLREKKRTHRMLGEQMKQEEIALHKADYELENRLNYLREEYTLSFEAAKEQYPLVSPKTEVQKRVKLIRLAITDLGTVNIGAIEEYQRIDERYTFLMAQKEDLIHAKETLYQVISEMDEEMQKRFGETFQAIKIQFESTFRKLFGGGRADLVLTDPTNLLESGIDIVAQPPGKKLQNLTLLSGGERAFTAIALLFSILQVRPVPFCILDEVEAALDEANVSRFAQYVKQFSNQTQFVVITHRKGTMEESDVLYGVTMQESGVSKLVSVRLADDHMIEEKKEGATI